MSAPKPTIAQRFEMKVDRSGGPNACHLWRGNAYSDGFGQFYAEGKNRPAHRAAWSFAHGDTLHRNDDVVQTCGNRLCVNVAHLDFRKFLTPEERFWKHVDKNGPVPEHAPHLGRCWVWTRSGHVRGYGQFSIDAHGHVRTTRFVWFLTYGEWPSRDLRVCHRCDNPQCVRPDHLFLGTDLDNARDAISKGRRPTKLRAVDSDAIREEPSR